jgi:hypothetical protein
MREINLDLEVMILKGYIEYYNTHTSYTKENLYHDYYGDDYKDWMRKGTLEKYLER